MVSENTPIDYRYLNMDTGQFVESAQALKEQIRGRGAAVILRAIPSWNHAQCLIAGGRYFEEEAAIIVARRLGFVLSER